jgi:hypothetical protein
MQVLVQSNEQGPSQQPDRKKRQGWGKRGRVAGNEKRDQVDQTRQAGKNAAGPGKASKRGCHLSTLLTDTVPLFGGSPACPFLARRSGSQFEFLAG